MEMNTLTKSSTTMSYSHVHELYVATRFVFLVCFVIVILVQLPWILYFIIKIVQGKLILKRIRKNQDQSDVVKGLALKHKNNFSLHKYLLTATIFELSTMVMSAVNYSLSATQHEFQFNCSYYYVLLFVYAKYTLELVNVLFFQSTLEVLNITTLFVKDVYLRNSAHSVMRKKINRFVLRFLLVLGLGVSGVGLGIAYVICEVFLITQLVLYYRYSRQLYRALRMHYEDTKYEFGSTSVEARTVLKQKKHYKYFTIWFYSILLTLVLSSIAFGISLPQRILGEDCILEFLTNNSTTLNNSTVYEDINFAVLIVSPLLYGVFIVLFIPVYTVYSMYYLCDKFLFVNRYSYRYHVRYSVGLEDLEHLLIEEYS